MQQLRLRGICPMIAGIAVWLVPAAVVCAEDDHSVLHQAGETHDAEAGHTSEAEHGHHEHIGEKGVNREPQEFRSDLAIFTLIVFGLLYFSLKKFAWPQIVSALEAREAGIRQAVEDAENARREAQALLDEHKGRMEAIQEEVKEIIAEARRDAQHTKSDIIASAESEAQTIKDRSISEINRARDQALNELFKTMSSQVTTATEHVVGKGITLQGQDQLIDEALNHFAAQT